eukprot:CAMPEP_0173192096 /NCGR_PEP_ID=MMETSP1141-20130122/13239_1 /TAXON_ID=483371 /ORGANISM="non described non described, Strain CCMP2298" /LENGTH=325 /DNA_ID=CAMNT_0014116335 /DNA_START=76 /DNA_END=1053 /DNA_ORIENTATION=-
MSKSIRSFFTSAGPAKKAKLEVPSPSTRTRTAASSSAGPGEDAGSEGSPLDSTDAKGTEAQTEKRAVYLASAAAVAPAPAAAAVVLTAAVSAEGFVGWAPFDAMEEGWRQALAPEFKKPYMMGLLTFLNQELKAGKKVYPPARDIFSAFSLCPLSSVKVVIIGQDPYHGQGQAHGLAFSVIKGVQTPPSLRNMIVEAKSDVGIRAPSHGNLECWSRQGVLLLNTCLTVRSGEANSHNKRGWEQFTEAVVQVLRSRQQVVYLLWGKPAQTKCVCIDVKSNSVITTSHPSPLGAYKTAQPFIGSKCFSRCNDALVQYGKEPIDWSIV